MGRSPLSEYYGTKESDRLARKLGKTDLYSVGRRSSDVSLLNSVPMKNVAASVRKDYNHVREIRKENNAIKSNFYKREDYSKWVKKAAKADGDKHKKEYQSDGFDFNKLLNWCLYDDGAQGSRDPFEYWLEHSNEALAKKWIQNLEKEHKAQKAYIEKCESLINEYLGSHSGEGTTYTNALWNTKYTITLANKGKAVVDSIMRTWDSYENDFEPGTVSIEDLMRLVN